MNQYIKDFLLNPKIRYLNHGSFGATPQCVFKEYQQWQRKLEYQPTQFLTDDYYVHIAASKKNLASYINAIEKNIFFIPNVTFGVNLIARSLPLNSGDEIVITDHEYGACVYCWEYVCQKSGGILVTVKIPLPIKPYEIINRIEESFTSKTKYLFISHITSPTSIIFPVKELCQLARSHGILTIIDGAHAPGQIDLDIEAIDPDIYIGNCHKWLMAPKGTGFLYVKPDFEHLIEPLVVSWGWGASKQVNGMDLSEIFTWIGTHDPAANLSVPVAIDYQYQNKWGEVRKECHKLAIYAQEIICRLTTLDPIYLTEDMFYQMFTVRLPPAINPKLLKENLRQQYSIEIPCIVWNDQNLLRTSIQGYNDVEDIDSLATALYHLLPSKR
jgi:isopenicillin-N epimerase